VRSQITNTSSSLKKQGIISQKDINILLRVARGNWWVPLLVLPVFYAIGRFYVFRLTDISRVSTEFLLKVNDLYYQNNVLSDAGFYSSGGGYVDNVNEQRILKSYDLASQVVDKVIGKLQVSYYIVGKVRRTEQFNGVPIVVSVNSINADFYEKVIDLKILDYDTYEITYNKGRSQEIKKGFFGKELISDEYVITINRNENLSQNNVDNLKDIFYQFIIHSKDFLIGNIQGNLVLENPDYTNILKVGLNDILPERAVMILDTMNKVYAENRLKSKFELNDRTVEYIDKQLNEISFSLKSIEDTMQNYKQKKDIIDLSWEQNNFLAKITSFDDERVRLTQQLKSLDDLQNYIVEEKEPQFLPPSVMVYEKSGFMATAVNALYDKQIELNKLYGTSKEANPYIIDLKENIKKSKRDLLQYIVSTRNATISQIENINKEILVYVNQAKLLPAKQREMLNIQRRTNVSEQLYNFLLEKKANTKIARASIIPDIKIVEAPRYIGIDSPNKATLQKQFLTFGVLVSILVIVIRSVFYSKIKTADHLKELTDLPLIGVLPFVKDAESEGIIVEQAPTALISEAFRNFRTNLQYANIDINAKTYLVTSFLPGEGKTFTSSNLAAILAKSGKRTVLIELDLHKPRVYQRFGLSPQTKGITTCITGQNTYEEIISETYIPNLFCIYSGPIPPNPSELVLSNKMKEIIDRAKQDFDFVIIDTPPAGLLSDSLYLIQQVDASIFVLNTRTSSKKVVNFIESVIEANNLKNVLLLLNGVARAARRYKYQGYGYSYGYGYGYGYGKGYGKVVKR
jgi:capsular exopolysaccharide synthesis family protein